MAALVLFMMTADRDQKGHYIYKDFIYYHFNIGFLRLILDDLHTSFINMTCNKKGKYSCLAEERCSYKNQD